MNHYLLAGELHCEFAGIMQMIQLHFSGDNEKGRIGKYLHHF